MNEDVSDEFRNGEKGGSKILRENKMLSQNKY